MDALRFAVTKIQPPRLRSSRVARPQLDAALREALLQRRLVLLVAPAGFGKTCALATPFEGRADARAMAWVSLDEDDDAPRLFACLAAALESCDLPWRSAPEALLAQIGDGDAGMRRAVAELVNALAAADAGHGVIVLDDVHRIRQPSVFALLDALLERLPPQWTLVLASRTEPPLALARLRVGGELAEFGPSDLRFSADEAAALAAVELAAARRDGAAEQAGAQVAGLFERTQGWPAGLRLGLAALRSRPGSAAGVTARQGAAIDPRIFDYLAGEVLDDMPPELHDFLLRCSVLPTLTSARCAAVSGDPRAAERLDEVERRGLFVTALDAHERTLVLHDLFRDALGERLRRRLGAELPALMQRAAAGEPDPLRRVGYLLRAADPAAAEQVLAQACEELILQGGVDEVRRAIERFPDAWRASSARLQRLRAACLAQGWQWAEMAQSAETAVGLARAAGDVEELQTAQAYLAAAWHSMGRHVDCLALLDELRPQALHPQARLMFLTSECSMLFRGGRHDRLPEVFAEQLAALERDGTPYSWWACAPSTAWVGVRGMRPLVQRYGSAALQRIGEREIAMRADLRLLQAWALLWAGEVESAVAEAAITESDARWLAASANTEGSLIVFRAIVDAIHGRSAPVERMLDDWLARAAGLDPAGARAWRNDIAQFALRVHDVLGSAPAVLEGWASRLADGVPDPDRIDADALRNSAYAARHAAAGERWDAAAALFGRVLPLIDQMDTLGQTNELRLRAAHALLRCGRLDDAAQALAPALQRILAEREAGHALMCGAPVLSALAQAPWGDRVDARLLDELVRIAGLAMRLRADAASARGPAADPAPSEAGTVPSGAAAARLLSAREREVLERIASGDSNKLIARVLDISPHTVKRHVCNILDKLALESRGQAAAWLREHA